MKLKKKNYNINILINNAAKGLGPFEISQDGFEIAFQTNHLAHFLLTQLLLSNLRKNKARIINISSLASESARIKFRLFKTNGSTSFPLALYAQSKLCNVIFTNELARRYGNDIISYAVHPGIVSTEAARYATFAVKLFFNTVFIFSKKPFEGAQTSIFATLCDKNSIPNGSYLQDCAIKVNPNPLAHDIELAKKLWDTSEEYIAAFK